MLIPLLIFCLVIALALIYLGRRGRRVGDTPFCKKCRFDLRGKPAASTRCSECGSDLARPNAIIRGEHRTRRGLLATGLVLLLLAAFPLGVVTYFKVSAQDPYLYAPLWYLESRANSPVVGDIRAGKEIVHRITAKKITGARLSSLADRIIDVQSDLTKPWYAYHEEILLEAGRSGFTAVQVERLYRNSFESFVDIKPKLHQGGNVIIRSANRSIRPIPAFRWSIARSLSQLTIGPEKILNATTFPAYPSMTWSTYHKKLSPTLPLGPQPLKYSCDLDVVLVAPYASPHARYTERFDRTIEIVAPDVITDTLVTDAAREPALRASISEATLDIESRDPKIVIDNDDPIASTMLIVRVHVNTLQTALCMGVYIEGAHPVAAPVAEMFVPANDRDEWHTIFAKVPPGIRAGESVNLRLKFSQRLADAESTRLDEYWGLPIVLPNIPIRTFDAARYFNTDEPFRAAIENGLSCHLVRDASAVLVECDFKSLPLPVSYRIFLRRAGTLYQAGNEGFSYDSGNSAHFSGRFPVKAFPPGSKADIVLRPYLPPGPRPVFPTFWGGEIILKGQMIP